MPEVPGSLPPKARHGHEASLLEVERALSVLRGRHPEHERTRRETHADAENRSRTLARELADRARHRWRRGLLVVLGMAGMGAAMACGWRVVQRARAVALALAQAEERTPFLASGWSEVASNGLTGGLALSADAPGSSCLVALATGDAPFQVVAGGEAFEGTRSVGWCACDRQHVALRAVAAPSPVGLRLLRIDGGVLGGPRARAWAAVGPATWREGGDECADRELDAWIDAHRSAPPPEEVRPPGAGAASLEAVGFRPVAMVSADRPFGVVHSGGGECLLALGYGTELLSLRAPGGKWLLTDAVGAMAWCSAAAATWTVWRTGHSAVDVRAGPAARVGGLLGTSEHAAVAGVPVASRAMWIADADLPWEAAAVLRASLGDDSTHAAATALSVIPGADASRLVSVAFSETSRVAFDPPATEGVCDPPFFAAAARDYRRHSARTESSRDMLCVFASPVSGWRRTESPAASARAPLPFWLAPLEPYTEPSALARAVELLALERRLGASGFAPTLFDGVTELKNGVRIVGRSEEDAIVAVGIGPKAPWVFPFTDFLSWQLDGTPRVIALKPGESVKLTARPAPDAPIEQRRTVVFRRSVHAGGKL